MQGEDLLYVLGLVDIIFCSEEGALFASGEQTIDDAAQMLLDVGPSLVVVTMGARGAASVSGRKKL